MSSTPELTPDLLNKLKKKADVLSDITSYLKTPLRPVFEDSDRLYVEKPKKSLLDELGIVEPVTKSAENTVLRKVTDEEILPFQPSEEDLSAISEDSAPTKKTDPRYKKLAKSLEKFRDKTYEFNVPPPLPRTTPEPVLLTTEPGPLIPDPSKLMPKQVSFIPKQDAMVYYSQPRGPIGVVNVFKPCDLDVKNCMLKVDNIEISKRCNQQRRSCLNCPKTMEIDINDDLDNIEISKASRSSLDGTQTMQIVINKDNCGKGVDDGLAPLMQEIRSCKATINKVSVNKKCRNQYQTTCNHLKVMPKDLEPVLGLYKPNSPRALEVLESFEAVKDSVEDAAYDGDHTIYNCQLNRKNISVLGGKQLMDVPSKSVSIFYCKKCKQYKNAEELSPKHLRVKVSSKKGETAQYSLPNLSYLSDSGCSTHRKLFSSKSSCKSEDCCKTVPRNKFSVRNPSLDQFCKNIISSINKLSEKLPTW